MMKNGIAAIGLSLILLLGFVVIVVEVIPPAHATSIIYVDDEPGVGPGNPAENYTSIQDAIDAANPGDSIYIYNGTYFENVIVDKTINLIGEDRNDTIINGSRNGDVIRILDDWVNVSYFSLEYGGLDTNDAGIELYQVENCSIFSINAINNHEGISLWASYINIITNSKASNNWFGIHLDFLRNNTITKNNVSNNGFGIYLEYSSSNTITNNNVSCNIYTGILLSTSSCNTIANNTASLNNWRGIHLRDSTSNTITNNEMVDNGVFILGEMLEHWNTHFIDATNTVNGKPVHYWKNQTGGVVPLGAGQIILANSTNVVIENQNVSNSDIGIELGFSSNNQIANNNISSNNYDGIYLYKSSNNTIDNNNVYSNNDQGIHLSSSINNTIDNNNVYSNNHNGIYLLKSNNNTIAINNASLNNLDGIRLVGSTSNIIYHNNIINNTNQAVDNTNNGNQWDNGYPSGGNYWSDYSGVDNFKGSNQDIPGSDGIGDINYSIDSDSVDNYPLIAPYKPLENYTVLRQGWNLISIPLIQEEQNLTRVLGSIDGWYDAVQWWDVTDVNDPWKHNKIGKPYGNDLFELNESMGFWVHITEPGDTIFIYNGTQPSVNQMITLYPGWNQVGYPSKSVYNRTEGLNTLDFGTEIDKIQWNDASTQTWHEMGPDDNFVPTRGYWIHVKTQCLWDVLL